MKIKTTNPGLKFVAGKVFMSRWFADRFIDILTFLMSEDVDLGRLPLRNIEISEWIQRAERLELGGIDFSSWKSLRGLYRLAQFLHSMKDDPTFADPFLRQTNSLLPANALDEIKRNLEKSAFDEVNRLCTEVLRKAGAKGTFDMVGLLAIVRAAQTGYRCVARYRISPIRLIEQARQGSRKAVLTLIKLDKLFCRDSCTKNVLEKALLSNDRLFNEQVARAQLFKPTFNRRDACEVYMMILIGLRVALPPMFKVRSVVDPRGAAFPGNYDFEKCFERLKRNVRLDSTEDAQIDQTCVS